MEQSWGMDLIRSFFGLIDKAVYSLVATIYQIILDLANSTILGSAVIEDLYTRMYTLLGLFMVFKVTFSFVNYLINPDSFTDKQQGVQNLIKNVLVVFVLIIITPFAFDELYKVQNAILDDALIPKFLLGVSSSSSDVNVLDHAFFMSSECEEQGRISRAASDGDYLALMTLRPFYQLEETMEGYPEDYCPLGETVNTSSYLRATVYNEHKGSPAIYLVDYRFFLSTVVGIVVALILVSFCFDIAVRSIKLGFLEMLAPIPIMSYVDPKSSKNGMFSKWLKQVGATWASLFIRLIALFFAILVISKLDVAIEGDHKFWTMLFILIGALIFAKQLPKLLEELIPGLKLGGMQLNPFKKVANEAMGGKTLLGLGAGALGLGLGSLSHLGSYAKDKLAEMKDKKELEDNPHSYNNFKKRAVDMATRYGWSDERLNKFLDQKRENLANGTDPYWQAVDKFNEKQLARARKFSFQHPILGNLSQAFTGAKMGFEQGKNGKFNATEIGHRSSKVREYKNDYSVADRVREKTTDFFGIKNDSGTTSIVAEDIKKNEEVLTRINRNIEMMNRQFSSLATQMGPAEFARAFSVGKDGNYQVNPEYAPGDPTIAGYFSDIKSLLTQMNNAETERLRVTKDIKRLQKIKDRPSNLKK